MHFGTLAKKDDVIQFSLALRLQKVCDSIRNRLSYMHTTLHGPSLNESNFRWEVGMIHPPPGCG